VDIWQLFIDLLLGVVLGALGGLFGIGGGMVAIPVLGLLFGLDQMLAQGTALVMVVPNVLLALWRYHQRNRIDWRQALALGLSGLICAWLAAQWALGLDAANMRIGFAVFLLLLGLYNLARLCWPQRSQKALVALNWLPLTALGSLAGALGGVFGVGGAVLATPVLTSLFGVGQVTAQGLSLALAAPSTAVTLASYAAHAQVDWLLGVPLALGGLLGIGWGVRAAHALPERVLRGLFSAFLLVSAALLIGH
jgi:uncharacterized membrane protein YfcA